MRIRYSEVSVLAFDNSEKKDKTFFACMMNIITQGIRDSELYFKI